MPSGHSTTRCPVLLSSAMDSLRCPWQMPIVQNLEDGDSQQSPVHFRNCSNNSPICNGVSISEAWRLCQSFSGSFCQEFIRTCGVGVCGSLFPCLRLPIRALGSAGKRRRTSISNLSGCFVVSVPCWRPKFARDCSDTDATCDTFLTRLEIVVLSM